MALHVTDLPAEKVDGFLAANAAQLSEALDKAAASAEPLTEAEENDPALAELFATFGKPV